MKTISLLLLAACFTILSVDAQNNPRGVEVDWETNLEKHKVPLNEFTTLLQPDQIPPIYDPSYIEISEARDIYLGEEPVISVEINGDARAYPLSVLMFHEIVNDEIGNRPVSVTYCPLCNAAMVFDRRVVTEEETITLDFGVSGMLRKSDLVMWDHQTESWWQQLTGEALVGDMTGQMLKVLPSQVISLNHFIENHPDGIVLEQPRAANRRYGTNPYVDYDDLDNNNPFLFDPEPDPRLPAMERVADIKVNGEVKAYPFSILQEDRVVHDEFNEKRVVLFYSDRTLSVLGDGEIKSNHHVGAVGVFNPELDGQHYSFYFEDGQFKDEQTGSEWTIAGKAVSGPLEGKQLRPITHGNHFAFALLAFYPNAEIYE